MRQTIPSLTALLLAPLARLNAAEPADPFLPYLDDKTPEILRKCPRRTCCRRTSPCGEWCFCCGIDSQIFAVIATPKMPCKHPGMLVLHCGGGSAEEAGSGVITTMVCGLAGDQVAGFSVWGCGFYELTAQLNGPKSNLGAMPEEEGDRWPRHLDASRLRTGHEGRVVHRRCRQ